MFKRLLKRIKAQTIVNYLSISKLGVGLAATNREDHDTAPRRDLTGPEEDNESSTQAM